ncbi:HXXEE domain-containing protein [Bacillus massilinigeriensis]|uniref:HXXEE domain-containing protein n=1 Tax=Bacillus massilionigeriensis TaxID=1805475 RepID=UPI00096B46AB|nr:HXXEE domain-containing protein [Bacillus massilionigeriensis]
MGEWIDIQTLIWLFPIIFVFHDFEEIIMAEKWFNTNYNVLSKRIPTILANRVLKHFSMTTAQFAVAVLIVFLFVSSSTFMASQYLNDAVLGNIEYFTVFILTFFIHVFTHIGQSIYFRSITPGVITSVFIVLPYSIIMLNELLENELITWDTIFTCLPFVLLVVPIVVMAHLIGKKLV